MKWLPITIGLAGGLCVAACASSEPPVKQLADAQASIRAARELGAEQYPEAALHLKLARDRVDDAQRLSSDGEHEQAKAALQEADHDAEVAVALLKQKASEDQAAAAKQKADSVSAKAYEPAPGSSQAPSEVPEQGAASSPAQPSVSQIEEAQP